MSVLAHTQCHIEKILSHGVLKYKLCALYVVDFTSKKKEKKIEYKSMIRISQNCINRYIHV